MTLKEIMKRIEKYNEVAELMGETKKVVVVSEQFDTLECRGTTWKKLKAELNKEYIPQIIEEIEKKELDFTTTYQFEATITDAFGYTFTTRKEIRIEDIR